MKNKKAIFGALLGLGLALSGAFAQTPTGSDVTVSTQTFLISSSSSVLNTRDLFFVCNGKDVPTYFEYSAQMAAGAKCNFDFRPVSKSGMSCTYRRQVVETTIPYYIDSAGIKRSLYEKITGRVLSSETITTTTTASSCPATI